MNEERLRAKSEFNLVFEQGQSYANKAAVLYVYQDVVGRKAGFSVSKRVGNAVARNRVRRIMKEVYRGYRQELNPNVYLIVIARKGIERMSFFEIKDYIGLLFKKADILQGED